MTSAGIRAYIRAPAPRDVIEREYPLEQDVGDRLAQVFVWIFGLPRSAEDQAEGKQSRDGRAISDSRELSRLGKAIEHPKGLAALEGGENLERAERAMLDIRAQFNAAIDEATTALEVAMGQRPKRLSRAQSDALDRLNEMVEKLKQNE
jgi:hypothetical protein